MKYCGYCGTAINDDMKFCTKCGKPQCVNSESEINGNTGISITDEMPVKSSVDTNVTNEISTKTNVSMAYNVAMTVVSAIVSVFIILQMIAPLCRPLKSYLWIESYSNLYGLIADYYGESAGYMFTIPFVILISMSILALVWLWKRKYFGTLLCGLVTVIANLFWTMYIDIDTNGDFTTYAGFGITALLITRIVIPVLLAVLLIVYMKVNNLSLRYYIYKIRYKI